MSSFDSANNFKGVLAIAPVQATVTKTGLAVDSTGYSAVSFTVATGVAVAPSSTNKFTFTVESSPDNSVWTAIAADEYIVSKREDGTTWDKLLDAAGDASAQFVLGARVMTSKYFRVVATLGGAGDFFLSATAELAHSRHKPN